MPLECIESTIHKPIRDKAVKPAHDNCELETFCTELALMYHICSLYVVKNMAKFFLFGF